MHCESFRASKNYQGKVTSMTFLDSQMFGCFEKLPIKLFLGVMGVIFSAQKFSRTFEKCLPG